MGIVTSLCLLLAVGNLASLGYWRLRVLQMGGGILLRPGGVSKGLTWWAIASTASAGLFGSLSVQRDGLDVGWIVLMGSVMACWLFQQSAVEIREGGISLRTMRWIPWADVESFEVWDQFDGTTMVLRLNRGWWKEVRLERLKSNKAELERMIGECRRTTC